MALACDTQTMSRKNGEVKMMINTTSIPRTNWFLEKYLHVKNGDHLL